MFATQTSLRDRPLGVKLGLAIQELIQASGSEDKSAFRDLCSRRTDRPNAFAPMGVTSKPARLLVQTTRSDGEDRNVPLSVRTWLIQFLPYEESSSKAPDRGPAFPSGRPSRRRVESP